MTVETPETEAALVDLVKAAGEGGHALATEGAGTKRHYGPAAPTQVNVRRVSLARLSRVTAHEPADMILTVQAGARLSDVQRVLAAHEQWLPIDPPFAAHATIGGVLATNSSGPRRLGYGTIKDQLLGVRVVGAAGQVTKSGGRVVKNVSGFDLHRPQAGAFGTLGVLVEAHFKVRARPQTSAVWAFARPSLGSAHRLLLDVAATSLTPVALEALDAPEASLLRARVPGLPGEDALALVGVEGARETFERHARDLGARAAAVVFRDADAAPLWAALAELPAAHAGDVRVRVGARPHQLPGLVAALEPGAARGVSVRAGLGLAFVSVAPDAAVAPSVARWGRLAEASGGYAVVESAPLDVPARAELPFGASRPSGPGEALRRAWDPRGTLNPGRLAP
jgi:glycolate oxidase FAD binding subunit